MTASPDAVLLYVPLMKETNMTWEEIKQTPRHELEGLLAACHEYTLLHSMDGYDASDISEMAKNKPAVRGDWNRYMEQRRKYENLIGKNQDASKRMNELKAQLG